LNHFTRNVSIIHSWIPCGKEQSQLVSLYVPRVSLPLPVSIFPERERERERERQNREVKQQDRKNRKAVCNSLDQIPIRIPTINAPQLAHGTSPVYDFRAFEDLRIGETKHSHQPDRSSPNGNRTNKWDGFGWIERSKTRRLSQLTSIPASFQAAKTSSIGVSVMKHKSPEPGWT
jgi:hypothetical protein